MYTFDCVVRAMPPSAAPGEPLAIADVAYRPLVFPLAELATAFAVTFEETLCAFERLEQMFAEPDGSFVWVAADRAWQIDGNLYDRDGRLLYVELRGRAPAEVLDRLLSALGWPAERLAFEWRAAGVFLGEEDFRRVAAQGFRPVGA
jgi:hypothetical protein